MCAVQARDFNVLHCSITLRVFKRFTTSRAAWVRRTAGCQSLSEPCAPHPVLGHLCAQAGRPPHPSLRFLPSLSIKASRDRPNCLDGPVLRAGRPAPRTPSTHLISMRLRGCRPEA